MIKRLWKAFKLIGKIEELEEERDEIKESIGRTINNLDSEISLGLWRHQIMEMEKRGFKRENLVGYIPPAQYNSIREVYEEQVVSIKPAEVEGVLMIIEPNVSRLFIKNEPKRKKKQDKRKLG